jgi:hypothetical protein
VNTHRRYVTAKAALATVTGLVVAGCTTSASTSNSALSTAGSAATSGANSGSTPGVVPAAALAFPVAVGNTWVYSSAVPSAGSTSTLTDKVLSVAPVFTGNRVTESYSSSLSSGTVHTAYVFHADGSITVPLSQVSGGTLSSPSGGMVLPPAAVIASGRPYRYVMRIGFNEVGKRLTETTHVTVQGAGTATVTVPAGTYRATIIDVTFAWTIARYTLNIEIRDWFANGTGTVKSEAIIHEAGLTEVTSTEELKSFTRG